MKHFRGTLVFFLGVLLFGGYIFYFEFKKPKMDEEMKGSGSLIFSVTQESIKSFEIQRGKETLQFEKIDKDHWKMLKPFANERADQFYVNSVLLAFSSEKYEEVVAEGADINLKMFGFENPTAHLRYTTDSGATQELLVSSESGLGGKRYVKKADENRVLLASFTWESVANKPMKEMRDARVFEFSRGEIQGLKVKSVDPKNSYSFALQKEGGKWSVFEDKTIELDSNAVTALLETFESLKSVEFAANDKKEASIRRFGLREPYYTFEFNLGGNAKPLVLKLSKAEREKSYLVSSSRETIFEMTPVSTMGIRKSLSDLRDKTSPFKNLQADLISKIQLKVGSSEYEIKNDAAKWELTAKGVQKPVTAEQLQQIKTVLKNLQVKSYLSSTSEALVSPQKGLLTIFEEDPKKAAMTIRWGGSQKGEWIVKASSTAQLFVMNDMALNIFEKQMKDIIQPPEPPKANAADAEGLQLKGAHGPGDGHDHSKEAGQ